MGYHQTNQKTDTGKTLTRWPVFVDHFNWLGVGNQQAGTAANQYSLNGDSLRSGAMSLSSSNSPAYTLNPTFNLQVNPEVGLTLQSDVSRLSDYIDFNAKASAASFEQSLTLAISSGQSSTGG